MGRKAVAENSDIADCDHPNNPQRKAQAALRLLALGAESASRKEAIAEYEKAKKNFKSLGNQTGISLADDSISKVDNLPFEYNIDVQIAKTRRRIYLTKRDGLKREQKKEEERLSQLEKLKNSILNN